MRQLSGLDAGFLYVETPETPMHVGSLIIFELPDGMRDFAAAVREHVRGRLHLAPIFTQRIALMPFDLGHPVWVEAGSLDFNYHFQAHRLAKPGSQAQLDTLTAQLHSELLDRECPLWQFHVIEGLSNGQAALYTKVHHAALDGAAGAALAGAILDLGPTPREVPPAGAAKSLNRPSRSKLLGSLFSNTLAQYAKIARALPGAVKRVASAAREQGVRGTLSATKGLFAPRTLFNVGIEAMRSYATLSLPLSELKAVAAACGATLNDVVLALCSGSLRRYLLAHEALPDRSLIAAVPISLRELGDLRQNNQVTMLPCSLSTDATTAEARLTAVQAAMAGVKATSSKFKDMIPTDYPSLGAPWLIAGLTQLVGKTRLADRIPLPVNIVISNVAGPRVPLFLAGAKMLHYYPVSIVVHGLALNITVHSYCGRLDFGFIACANAVPDPAALALAVAAEHAELKALAARYLLGPSCDTLASALSSPRAKTKAPLTPAAKSPKRKTPRSKAIATPALIPARPSPKPAAARSKSKAKR